MYLQYIARGHLQVNEYLFRNSCIGQRFKMDRFGKKIIVFNDFSKNLIINLWDDSEYAGL